MAVIGHIIKTDWTAQNTILASPSAASTPVAIALGDNEFIGRNGAANIAALSATDVRSILNIADGAIANIVEDTTPQLGGMLDVNANSIGDGTLELLTFTETGSAVNEINITNAATGNGPSIDASGDDANIDLNLDGKGTGDVTISGSNLDVTGNIAVSGTVDGRDIDADGTKLDGAVLEADFDAQTILAATADDTPAALTIAEETIVGRITDGNIVGLTAAQVLTLINVEAAADVTDATNVNAAGATMNTDTDVKANDWTIDENDMASDLDTKVPTQQSVKAYVDDNAGVATPPFTKYFGGNMYVGALGSFQLDQAMTLTSVVLGIAEVSAGANVTIEIKYHATLPGSAETIFTAALPAIVAGNHTVTSTALAITDLAKDGWLVISCTIIGSTPGSPGNGLSVSARQD